jgi:hypothetical protein
MGGFLFRKETPSVYQTKGPANLPALFYSQLPVRGIRQTA